MAKTKKKPIKELTLEELGTAEATAFQNKLETIDSLDIDDIVEEINGDSDDIEQNMSLIKGLAIYLKRSAILDSEMNEKLVESKEEISDILKVDVNDFELALKKFEKDKKTIETTYQKMKQDNDDIKKLVNAYLDASGSESLSLALPIGKITASNTQVLDIMPSCEDKVVEKLFDDNTLTAIRVGLESYPKLNELILHLLNTGLKIDPLCYSLGNKFKITPKIKEEKKK